MKRIVFYSEKKGVGKSTLTLLISQVLKSRFQLNPIIFDYDGYLSLKRANEIPKLEKIPIWKEKIKDSVEIHPIKTWQEYCIVGETLEKNKDLALFDLKDIGQEQIRFLLNAHYIFIISDVIEGKEYLLDKEQYNTFQKIRYSNVPFEKVFMVFNKLSGTTKEIELDIDEIFPMIENKEFFRETNISTIVCPSSNSINALAGEIYKIVFNQEQQYYQ